MYHIRRLTAAALGHALIHLGLVFRGKATQHAHNGNNICVRRYQNIFRIVVWFIFLGVYSQAGPASYLFPLLEPTDSPRSPRAFDTSGISGCA